MKAKLDLNVEALIQKAGGLPRLTALLGVARTTVLGWKQTGFIPANRVSQISDALELRLEDVAKLAQGPKTRKKLQPLERSKSSKRSASSSASSAEAA